MQEKKEHNLQTEVRYLKGVGPKKSENLSKVGIGTVEDLLYYLPRRYEDRSHVVDARDLKGGVSCACKGEIVSVSSRVGRNGSNIFQAVVQDATGRVTAVWFNQPYLKEQLTVGTKVVLFGRVEIYDRMQFVHPDYEILESDGETDSIHIGRIVPIYPATADITQKYLRGLVFQALQSYHRVVEERLPTYIMARRRLVDIRFALYNIHFPGSADALLKAYRRIVFDEFFFLQVVLALKRAGQTAGRSGIAFKAGGGLAEAFLRTLTFELTEAQKRAMTEIAADMSRGAAMNRLLEGDVGSGKTVVSVYALTVAVQNGYQGVIMAPTEVLARQHYVVLSELLMPLGVNVGILVSGMDDASRRRVVDGLKSGDVDIVVGTHAVIQESVAFRALGIVVIDEQHKFGVTQRGSLLKKGQNPHVLVMTATPIPRTLAMTVYGDLDITVLDELPKGRKPVVTYWVEEEKRRDVYAFIREEIDKGRQAFVVCPLIEKGSNTSRGGAGAVETLDRFMQDSFKGYAVGLLHGKMKPQEKDRMMSEFKKGAINILVSTTVVEVGIDVPNATVMLIESAERFGLAQLHQLRGRVGRGGHESYCILLGNPKTDEAARRLKAIEGTLDGFEIAEEDLEIRGPGDFIGTRQHGLPELKFGDIVKDVHIMEEARAEASALVVRDPAFREEHHGRLRQAIEKRFGSCVVSAKVVS